MLDGEQVLRTLESLKLPHGPLPEAETRRLAGLLDADRLVSGRVRAAGGRLRIDLSLTAATFSEITRNLVEKTLAPVRLLALSRNDFLSLLRRSPDLGLAVIEVLCSRLRTQNDQASALSFQRVKDRTKGLLQRLAKSEHSDGTRSTPTLTHQQIADMIGTSRETVTRVVKELKQDGWLDQEGKHYLLRGGEGASPEA